jgi:TetR/AcrR family transcriptional regulator, mexJK operon transcriptional repressor
VVKRTPGRPPRKKKDPTKGGRPTKIEAAQRTVRILEISTKLFIDHGYTATTLDEIARSAGVAKKTLNASYGGKAEIFSAVVRYRVARSGISELGLTLDKGSAKKTLKAAAERLLQLIVAEESVDLRRLLIAESRRFPELMQGILGVTQANIGGIVAALLEEMNTRGLLRVPNAHTAAKHFMDLTIGRAYLHSAAGLPNALPTSAELDEKIAMYIKYYS